ncbi:DUF2125 domain-containing protein [Thalassobius sp. MITS945101]|uniref:DUF2125 domain-containing protein n=1 Tax=Thalassobius sp. MITS945101 TaxID=3096994 RepID=UPI00399B144B
MKRLLIAVIAAATLWAAYWGVGAFGVKSAFTRWFDDRRSAGWVAETSDLSVAGFPNRFDTTMTDLILADPASGWAWEAPFFQIFALSYRPNHVIAVWPEKQLIATPLAKYEVSSARMQASIVTEGTDLALARSNLAADTLQITGPSGDGTNMTALRVGLLREGESNRYRFALTADDLTPARAFRALVDQEGTLPRTLSAFSADITMGFDAPWDRHALEQARPQPTALGVKLVEAKWGELELALAGDLEINAEGWANGKLTVKARNWREIVEMSVAAGVLRKGLAETLTGGLQMVAGMSGNPNTLDLPLTFYGETLYFGPIPLGPAPNFGLR